MSTTPHPIAPEEIMAHLDGELSGDGAQSISGHIETCTTCQELVTSLRNTSHALSNWTVVAAPVNAKFTERLSAAVAKVRSRFRSLKFQVFPIQRGKLLTASAVLAVLVITIMGGRASRYQGQALHYQISAPRSGLRLPESKPLANLTPIVSPGVADDTNGLLHGLGDHAGDSMSLDGQSISDQQTRVSTGPMVSRTVSLSLFTKDFESSRASLETILVRHNGYAAELNIATPQNTARSLQASLRIPAPQLAAALAELKSLGRVEGETQNGEEVTQQHADLVARLKNSRETEQRLQAILTQRTGKISDVLGVEREIARVRGEIEQMEAEQKNLEHRVDFATINLQLSEEYKAMLDPPAPAISTLIHNAAVHGYRHVADTLLAILLFFAEYGPVLIFWIFLFSIAAWLVWHRWRHAVRV
jgi:hypothetical protein